MFRNGIGPTEILLVLGVVLLLFGGRKLPELARGSGRALRIFKSEVKELGPDKKDSKDETPEETLRAHEDGATAERLERERTARPDQV